ncbi:PVC-type heme-binding CxxCH protein [Prosthecobacter dejongeii]|uniref:Putative membrane-bound dehydrogenase-like protein n=1 Tax=Prosthecobacter dejongeii TaxID=48465 RepID=A0A7W7YMZ8_9BACT|nr:PVC-type heme-binding CxxCH protein [Prosthecobacter dejongeii]MBB5039163.1 putative membrane-bound dehydrogenase-like protein [Prosthecobacter dejongeii]
MAAKPLRAADLPPDSSDQIPAEGKRETVIIRAGKLPEAPPHTLPDRYELEVAAASPLVTHPIMGCVDDQGRLFIGDAVGVNWNKAQLEKNPPNRILVLDDTDQDGVYDQSTVFADKMTFPQGAAWLDGSLYVCSPPGLWKLTDKDKDGVAEEREMIVSGFDYTGNAADVHGPKLHPNGRLYWCHGRKGHVAAGKDGKVVHEGKASGVWSCLPDGTDLQWHSLGCADNPTGLAFTAEGDILGTCNLYYSNPRGDTLMHWLYGGVYERADQMQAIAGLPRTMDVMPVIHNFGHVAVSGCAFGGWGSEHSKDDKLHLYVTHFNTQRLVRMELTASGATFKATENEFLKIKNPDVHLTDVIEDQDGSLLVLNTGGWFRIGCPSSLMAKPDMMGSVYRIRGPKTWKKLPESPAQAVDSDSLLLGLQSTNLQTRRRALEKVAHLDSPDIPHELLISVLASVSDAASEHAAILASSRALRLESDARNFLHQAVLRRDAALKISVAPLSPENQSRLATKEENFAAPEYLARVLKVADLCGVKDQAFHKLIIQSSIYPDAALFKTAMGIAARDPELVRAVIGELSEQIAVTDPTKLDQRSLDELNAKKRQTLASQVEVFLPALLSQIQAQELLTQMLVSNHDAFKQCALRILAGQTLGIIHESWIEPLKSQLVKTPTPLLLDAIKKLKSAHFDGVLQDLAANTHFPLSIRLKALDAVRNVKLTAELFEMITHVLTDATASPAARIQAANMISSVPMTKEQVLSVAPLLASVGPVELKSMLTLARKTKDPETGRKLALHLAANPAIGSQQESVYRTAFSDHAPEIFETLLHPAYEKATAAMESKKRQLGALADRVIQEGRIQEGKKHFELGKGTCIACHRVGAVGRALGPDLSKIGAIRTERDLLESILFPSNTLARDYEAHVIETRDGQSTLGVIRSHTAEGLLLMDVAGQEKTVAHDHILSDTTLMTSLMPMGLDATMPEQELLDLVAYLRSLK